MPEDLLIVFESPCLLLWLQLLSKYCKTFRGKKERDRFSGIVYSKSETKNPVSALPPPTDSFAFRMYFTPPGWCSEDGGTLDLFSVDANGCPSEVKCSLVPSFNSVSRLCLNRNECANNLF